jgi:hypothetical protein
MFGPKRIHTSLVTKKPVCSRGGGGGETARESDAHAFFVVYYVLILF